MDGQQDSGPDLGASIIQTMETEWYAVLRDPPVLDKRTGTYREATTITVQCRICPWAIHFDDWDAAQIESAVAAFIAHAKKLHKRILRDKRIPTEKL